jgi:L-rhamnose-H+ transport protein
MDGVTFPLLLVAAASVFQGTFGLGMKNFKPLSWEAWWLIYSLVAMVVLPLAWALAVVPDLAGSVAAAPSDAVFKGMLFGFLWGVGGILFGLSVAYVGMSLTYGIVMGLASAVGSLVPLAQVPDAASRPAFPFVLAGVALMLLGVVLAAWAGVQRDRAVGPGVGKDTGAFRKGLLIAISSGVLSALLNVGFAAAAPIAAKAVERGALVRNSSLAAWVVVLLGAFVMNAGYAGWLLWKNRSAASYASAGAGRAYGWAVLTGVLWFAALGVYGQGAALMGSLGPIIGWPMLLALALIVSNALALRGGEWKGATGPFRVMLAGVGVLMVACCLLGYANSVQ